MIRSMTGYGKHELTRGDKRITVEIKSLNSRYLDLNVRIPSIFREFEVELRNVLSKLLVRGKIDVSINLDYSENARPQNINKNLLKAYFDELSALAQAANVPQNELFLQALRMPNVISANNDDTDKEEWTDVLRMVDVAVANLDKHRTAEGFTLAMDLTERIFLIKNRSDEIDKNKAVRSDKVKQRILQHLQDAVGEDKVDQNRFEQELIFYLEKLDITEEIVRLNTHCNYYLEILDNQDQSKGRKLEFITQEIGREINTIGSKANDAVLQKIVVEMKDELEKIKEQCANLL